MLNKNKEERERKVKVVFHDVKTFIYGVSVSTGLIVGFALGAIMSNKK